MEVYFAKIITNDDNFPKKPDPASFLHLITGNELPRDKIIAIGDRDIDIQTARAATIKSCYLILKGKL